MRSAAWRFSGIGSPWARTELSSATDGDRGKLGERREERKLPSFELREIRLE
jgi:hypothetical protein